MDSIYALSIDSLIIRRFDTPAEREDFVANLVWDWLGKGSNFSAEYITDAVILSDDMGNKCTIDYIVKETE